MNYLAPPLLVKRFLDLVLKMGQKDYPDDNPNSETFGRDGHPLKNVRLSPFFDVQYHVCSAYQDL
jgi:hypothetical protein